MELVFKRMIKMQIIATIVVAVVAYVVSGFNAGLSAMAGGFAAIAGSFAGALVATGKSQGDHKNSQQNAGSMLIRLLKAEAVKIAVVVLVLWMVFKFFSGLVPLALIFGLAGAALFSGVAITSINEKSNL